MFFAPFPEEENVDYIAHCQFIWVLLGLISYERNNYRYWCWSVSWRLGVRNVEH